MFTFLLLIELLVSFLLIVVILMQSSKGGGLAGSFGGGSVGTVFGVRRTADFLSKSTTILATVFIVLCLIINLFALSGTGADAESIIQGSSPSASPTALPPRTTTPPADQSPNQ